MRGKLKEEQWKDMMTKIQENKATYTELFEMVD